MLRTHRIILEDFSYGKVGVHSHFQSAHKPLITPVGPLVPLAKKQTLTCLSNLSCVLPNARTSCVRGYCPMSVFSASHLQHLPLHRIAIQQLASFFHIHANSRGSLDAPNWVPDLSRPSFMTPKRKPLHQLTWACGPRLRPNRQINDGRHFQQISQDILLRSMYVPVSIHSFDNVQPERERKLRKISPGPSVYPKILLSG